MAGENTVVTASGLYKTVYGDEFQNPKHDWAILQKKLKFSEAERLGDHFEFPVALTHENGFTYNGTAGSVVALKAAKNAVVKPAKIYSSELLLRAQMANTYIDRAISKGKAAFEAATRFTLEEMAMSTRKRVEIQMLYGQKGLGTVSAISETSSTVGVITISEATWAGGIWAGMEGARIDSFTGTALNNTDGVLTITAVDCDARTLTVTYGGGSPFSGEVAVGDVLYFESAAVDGGTFNEFAGLQKIISNSGSLFEIDAATYSLWRGTTAASVGALDFQALQTYIAKAVNKGLMEKALVLVSPKGWSAFANDLSALRMLDSSYSSKKAVNGAESLEFFSQNGALEVVAHPMVKDGDCFILPEKSARRVGSCDVTFGVPGGSDQFFTWLPEYNAVEMRCRTDQAIFLERPAHAVYLSGITY